MTTNNRCKYPKHSEITSSYVSEVRFATKPENAAPVHVKKNLIFSYYDQDNIYVHQIMKLDVYKKS